MKRYRNLAATLMLSSLLAFFASDASAVSLAIPDSSHPSLLTDMPLIAHRGAAMLAPENTIPAFDAAVELQADFLELDIQMSRDGALIVLHDATVDRTTNGTGAVKDLTLDQLRALDAGQKFHPAFRGTKLPTLDEVLTRYGGATGLLLELKVPSRYPGIEQKLSALLQQHRLHHADSKIIVQSFDIRSLQQFHHYAPDVPLAVLVKRGELLKDSQLLRYAAYADYINPKLQLVTPSLVERVHELGMKVAPWTAHAAQDIHHLTEMGVDAVITDTLSP
ncbi:hypothetical protein CBW65_17145 [Tumebacillus avium]|uniref:GP-PDE domain-containing protein n=1 Tax=Tumebacillus avium TaxID=1903704 RepID=A0A1Y0IT21_9BACL|nr:glycerophosphodiester phosphodiesterase family protein [Tumebacillus avium]ARU62494.1 hypothetical protein CBW65_17145 [Tumebacillus avium]